MLGMAVGALLSGAMQLNREACEGFGCRAGSPNPACSGRQPACGRSLGMRMRFEREPLDKLGVLSGSTSLTTLSLSNGQARCLPERYAQAGFGPVLRRPGEGGDPALQPENPVRLSPIMPWREVADGLAPPGCASNPLSPAEQVVLAHLRQGLSNREIATTLGKSEHTVKNQVSTVLAKCGVPTRARLIALMR